MPLKSKASDTRERTSAMGVSMPVSPVWLKAWQPMLLKVAKLALQHHSNLKTSTSSAHQAFSLLGSVHS